MEKNKKKYYVIIAILVIYFLCMFIFIIYPAMKKSKRQIYIMVDNAAKWKFEGDKWEDIPDDESNLYNWQKFKLYKDSVYAGEYNLLYNDRFLVYDDQRKPVPMTNYDFLAVRSNQKFSVAEYETVEIDEEHMKYVEQILNEYHITSRELVTKQMIIYDIDSDGNNETIMNISNLFETQAAPSKIFSFIFVVKDDKITIVSKIVDTLDKKLNYCKPYIHSLIDTDNNKNYEIITGCGYYMNNKNCVEMYEYQSKKYQKIKSCSNE